MFRRTLLIIVLFVSALGFVFSQNRNAVAETGGAAMAEKYVLWAMDAIQNNRWAEAETGLERAADFADVSSDVSYLLALCQSHLNRPRGAVLYALDIALGTDRWTHYEASSALLLKAETYLEVKEYPGVIDIVNRLPESSDTMILHLRALKGLHDHPAFLRLMTQALNMYEHDPRPVSILFGSVDPRIPAPNERELVDLALRRLPLLVQKDPSLAYKAVPYVRNTEDARRLVQAYRAENQPHPESLPAALGLGVIDEETMMRDFFSYRTSQYSARNREEPALHINLLRELWSLLRNDASRDEFRRNLSSFSGVIVEDRNGDSYPESFSHYDKGKLKTYNCDTNQDRLSELNLVFYSDDEMPKRAEIAAAGDGSYFSGFSAYPLSAEEQEKMYLDYFRYPTVERVRHGETNYHVVYYGFLFTPIEYVPITGQHEDFEDMPMYPQFLGDSIPRLTNRSLVSFANFITRPSREFPEAIEEIHLTHSVVNHAREILPDGTIVSEMFFEKGSPYLQYVDLDADGRRETRRIFKRESGEDFPGIDPTDYMPILEMSESDWNGDDSYEYGEKYLPDGTIERSWDIDGDGIRETKEIYTDG